MNGEDTSAPLAAVRQSVSWLQEKSVKEMVAVIVFLLAASPSVSLATDWDSCASYLDDLRRAASDASDAAEEASSQHDEAENCDESVDFDDCESERDEFETAASDAESELDTVVSRMRAVSSTCDLTLSGSWRSVPSRPAPKTRCSSFQRFKGKLPLATLMETCAKVIPAAECARCLSGGVP